MIEFANAEQSPHALCSFEIDTTGNLNLAGKQLNINFQTINLKGQNIGNN